MGDSAFEPGLNWVFTPRVFCLSGAGVGLPRAPDLVWGVGEDGPPDWDSGRAGVGEPGAGCPGGRTSCGQPSCSSPGREAAREGRGGEGCPPPAPLRDGPTQTTCYQAANELPERRGDRAIRRGQPRVPTHCDELDKARFRDTAVWSQTLLGVLEAVSQRAGCWLPATARLPASPEVGAAPSWSRGREAWPGCPCSSWGPAPGLPWWPRPFQGLAGVTYGRPWPSPVAREQQDSGPRCGHCSSWGPFLGSHLGLGLPGLLP